MKSIDSRFRIVDLELTACPVAITDLEGYTGVRALVRIHGTPVGEVVVPVVNGACTASMLRRAAIEQHGEAVLRTLLGDSLRQGKAVDGLTPDRLLDAVPVQSPDRLPTVTVAVCTRDRADDLRLCLDALVAADYPDLEILVVDNAPATDATERLVREEYLTVRYVREPRPGLDWARNRAIAEARGEILAYTDDDVVVDRDWVRAIAEVFAENADVMAVTGLVLPYELETPAQLLFEENGGFSKGFKRRWVRVNPEIPGQWWYHGAGQFGTGANMAYRKCVFEKVGPFDPALDVGTATNGGGDLEMFFRVLQEGHTLVYEPRALVRHRHRREYEKLRTQLTNNGSIYSYFVRSARHHRSEWRAFVRLGLYWLLSWHIRRLAQSWLRPGRIPRDLLWAELKGAFIGLNRYGRAQRRAREIEREQGPIDGLVFPPASVPPKRPKRRNRSVAVRTIDLSQPLAPITDVAAYTLVRAFVTHRGKPLGSVDIKNIRQPVTVSRLCDEIVGALDEPVLASLLGDARGPALQEAVRERFSAADAEPLALPDTVKVSVVIATYDRPDDLRICLGHVMAQRTRRPVEIVVVDNNPSSGKTPPVVADFPGVVLVNEPRKGLAYARNAGFVAATGEVCIATDDDVIVPPDWLESMAAPFARADVMTVTGNVLPFELETTSQCLFEIYGGLGRGFQSRMVDGEWFLKSSINAAPTWSLGATANAAFRSSVFADSRIGLMDEALGPGMPSGVGEDTYLFYRILKAGHTLVYEPKGYVYHKHRKTDAALRRQIYCYSTGHVCYHLTTLLRDTDCRGLLHLLVFLPIWRVQQALRQIARGLPVIGTSDDLDAYSFRLILLEIWGNLLGPWLLVRSRMRVRREGRSGPYVPIAKRSAAKQIVLSAGKRSASLHAEEGALAGAGADHE